MNKEEKDQNTKPQGLVLSISMSWHTVLSKANLSTVDKGCEALSCINGGV